MQKIEPPDSHYFSAALGWLELGNPSEARAELARLNPGLTNHPDVLETRWLICAEEKSWQEGLQVAESLLRCAPKRSSGWLHRAYALRRVPEGGVQKAWDALLPASDQFPKESIIPYNLACYACQLQQLDTAMVWLKRAMTIGDKERIKGMALEDADLQALWKDISGV
jgi:hypothetical protein